MLGFPFLFLILIFTAPGFYGQIICLLPTVIRATKARVPACRSVPPEVAGVVHGFRLYDVLRAAADCSRSVGLAIASLDYMVAFSIFPPQVFFPYYALLCVRVIYCCAPRVLKPVPLSSQVDRPATTWSPLSIPDPSPECACGASSRLRRSTLRLYSNTYPSYWSVRSGQHPSSCEIP